MKGAVLFSVGCLYRRFLYGVRLYHWDLWNGDVDYLKLNGTEVMTITVLQCIYNSSETST